MLSLYIVQQRINISYSSYNIEHFTQLASLDKLISCWIGKMNESLKIGAFLSEIMFADSFVLQLIRKPCTVIIIRKFIRIISYHGTQCNRIMLNDMDYFLIFYKDNTTYVRCLGYSYKSCSSFSTGCLLLCVRSAG